MLGGLVAGRRVHFFDEKLEHCAADIVRVTNHNESLVNLYVLRPERMEIEFKENVRFASHRKRIPGSWHWIERVGADGKEQTSF